MLAKVIAHGPTREEAIARLERALREFVILGVRTNVPYLLTIIDQPAFRAGRTTTGFLSEHLAGWHPSGETPAEVLLALAADAALADKARETTGAGRARQVTPWATADGWRNAK
jgi:acetyl/propionyl-CoA carboxylase alpha subunit